LQRRGLHVDRLADHMLPKSLGGSGDVANLRTLCKRHNSRRGARLNG
jgi:5-methylcytosine-specific restriction endonuclease McrA